MDAPFIAGGHGADVILPVVEVCGLGSLARAVRRWLVGAGRGPAGTLAQREQQFYAALFRHIHVGVELGEVPRSLYGLQVGPGHEGVPQAPGPELHGRPCRAGQSAMHVLAEKCCRHHIARIPGKEIRPRRDAPGLLADRAPCSVLDAGGQGDGVTSQRHERRGRGEGRRLGGAVISDRTCDRPLGAGHPDGGRVYGGRIDVRAETDADCRIGRHGRCTHRGDQGGLVHAGDFDAAGAGPASAPCQGKEQQTVEYRPYRMMNLFAPAPCRIRFCHLYLLLGLD